MKFRDVENTRSNVAAITPLFSIVLALYCANPEPIRAATVEASRQEWNRTIKGAEKEGQLVLYANEGIEGSVEDFQKRFPRVKVVLVSGRSGQLVTRLMAERRAGKFIADVAKLGTGSASSLYRAQPFPLQPVEGQLFLSEVTDKSKWWQGRHQYADPEGKYILSPCVSVHIDLASYNTELVNPAELGSYWDLLNPKWKGRIGSMDPRAAGGREGGRLLYYHPELESRFLRRLLAETDLILSKDPRQGVDWLANGKLAFLLLTSPREVLRAKEQKLPVDVLDAALERGARGRDRSLQLHADGQAGQSQRGKTVSQLAHVARWSDLVSEGSRELRLSEARYSER